MSENQKAFVVAAIVCVTCSLLLTAASSGLKDYQIQNMTIDRHKNLLKSVGLIDSEKTYTPEDIESLYQTNIRALWIDSAGRLVPESERGAQDLPVYLFVQNDAIAAYIVPIDTTGLWGKINGYLAIKNDGSTIMGFTVYSHSETPGLGGEIERKWFQKNFEGKRIVNKEGKFVSVGIARGTVQDRIQPEQRIHFVDGISGATLTGKFLSAGLKNVLREYEPVSIKFRQHDISRVPGVGN